MGERPSNPEEMGIKPEDMEINSEKTEEVDWQSIRERAATILGYDSAEQVPDKGPFIIGRYLQDWRSGVEKKVTNPDDRRRVQQAKELSKEISTKALQHREAGTDGNEDPDLQSFRDKAADIMGPEDAEREHIQEKGLYNIARYLYDWQPKIEIDAAMQERIQQAIELEEELGKLMRQETERRNSE